jgi:hypothetical protein
MTVAVCLRCGAFKHGAFNACPNCRYEPDDDESLTKHLLATDHYLSQEQLEAVSEQVKSGVPAEFEPDMVQSVSITKEELADAEKEVYRGCWIALVTVFVLVCAALAVFVNWRS